MQHFFRRRNERIQQRRKARAYQTVLYTRKGCGLCDEAHILLLRHGFAPVLVDIDEDSTLVETYGNCVPVVTLDGKVRFRGRVNQSLLLRLLR